MPDTLDIDAESQRLKKQIDAAEELVATTADPDEKLAAQTRLDKLNDDYRLILIARSNALKPTPGAGVDTVTVPGVGAFTVDKTSGAWTPGPAAVPPNLDEQQLKAVENQMAGAKRDEIAANRAAGRGGLTDDQVRTLARLEQDTSINRDTLTLARQKWEQDNATAQAKLPGELAQTAATTARIGTQTALDQAQIDALGLKTTSDVERAQKAGLLDDAQAAAIRQKMGQPSITDLGTGATYGVTTPQGTIEERYRQGYVPKTRAEIAARAGQIHSLIQQKGAELQAKIDSKEITGDQALQQYNAWAAQNVQPQQTALAAAQEEADFARAKEEADQRRQSMTGALAAGTQAREAFTAAAPYRVGENYGQGFEKMLNASLKGSGHGDIDMTGSATWQGPDMMSQSPQQATMEALKYLSPTAAQATGSPQPNYQGVDLSSSFAPFQFGTTPPAPAAAPGASPAPTAAGVGPATGPFGTDQQQINRRLASFQTEAATNQQPGAFQGIDSQGMAGLIQRMMTPPVQPGAPAQPAAVGAGPAAVARFAPQAAPPAPPAPWGPQATQAMNVGGWGNETPWSTQASGAMNVGGWNSPMPDYPYGPPNLASNTTYTPPPELAPPGLPPGYMPGTSVGSPGLPGNVLPSWPSINLPNINPMGLWDQVTPPDQQRSSTLEELLRRGVPGSMLGQYQYGGGGGGYGNSGFTP